MEQILKNKYRINYKIATGKFTIIYNGTDLNKNEEIAIKEFPQEIKDNIFNNYLDLLKKLKGNNSINLIDNFKENNKYYIIMELCDSNLYELIEQYKNGLELPLILKILNQLNVALKNIIYKYLVYNYINPKDILIKYKDSKSKDFDIKLTGYLTGIILKNEINFDNYLLCYKAPELVGKKIDIWSLGITIYYMYYKEINIKKIKKNNLFLMNKKLNNINFKDLLSRLLNVDDKKRITWTEYFKHPFFSNILTENNDNHLLKEPLDLTIEKEKLNKIEEKQKKIIKLNKNLNINPNDKNNDKKNLMIKMNEVGTIYAEKINLIKKINPDYFLNIDEIIKNENNDFFPISILAKNLEKNGLLIAVEENENVSNEEILRNAQYISNGLCNSRKYEIRFDFDEKRNKELLEDLNVQNLFNKEIINEISKITQTPIKDIILCNPRKGSYKIDIFFSNVYKGFEGIVKILKKLSTKCNNIEIKEKPLLEGMILNTKMFDKRGNRNDGWAENEYRGGFPYYPPKGWTGYGINVKNKFDKGDNTWLHYDDSYDGVWSVVYHGTSLKYAKSIMEIGLQRGNNQYYKDDYDENHPNKKVGDGVYTSPFIEIAESYSNEVKGYFCAFMCRANPKLARICNEGKYWVLEGTSKDLRPYRLLIKKKHK